jgi:transposase
LVWRFVEELDLTALHATIKAVEGQPGHPPPDPRILVALWLFATIEGIGSAREVARLCQEHIAYQWLCGGVGMNAKTLGDFRIAHCAVLERLLVDSFTALIQAGVASLKRVAQDGVRVRAAAGAASFRRHSTLQDCRDKAAETVRRLHEEAEKDPAASPRRQAAARRRAAADRDRRVRDALAVAEALRAQQQDRACQEAERAATAEKIGAATKPRKEAEKEPRASTTDAEARIMKMAKPAPAKAGGGFRPAFNVQFASDTQSYAIAGVSVDNVGSDMGKMTPMTEILATDYGQRPEQYLADGGYAKLDDIGALTEIGIESYVPVPKPRDASRDRYAPRPSDPPGVAAWRERMGCEAAKAIYKERAATAECANAQARNRGLKQFVVRGLEKVKAIALWYALAHNMACTWRLVWA